VAGAVRGGFFLPLAVLGLIVAVPAMIWWRRRKRKALTAEQPKFAPP
jgi:hypothetical protein